MKLHLDKIRDFVTTNGLSFTEGPLKFINFLYLQGSQTSGME